MQCVLIQNIKGVFELFWSARSASVVSVAALSPRAHVFDSDLRAVLALYCATPVELAVTAAHYLRAPLFHPKTTLVAQSAAAAPFPLGQTFSVLHAFTTLCARKAEAQILGAVIRRVLQVYELCWGYGAERVCYGQAVVCAVPRAHAPLVQFEFLSLVVLDFQVIANLTKIR